MKKLISLILILCMACMLIPATAEGIDVTGEWYASVMGVPMTMTVNADGTVVMTSPAQEGGTSGTWTMEGDQITITIDESSLTGTVTAEAITLDDNGMQIVFTREPAETITVGAVKAADSEDAFLGTWACKYMESQGVIVDVASAGGLMPGLTIADGKLTFVGSSEDDFIAAMYNLMALTYTFADGKLAVSSSVEGADATGTIELTEDGLLKLTLDSESEPVVMYYGAAEAAEQPAA